MTRMSQVASKASTRFIVGGVLALLFGIVAFAVPGATVAVLLGFFAAWSLISGVAQIAAGVGVAEHNGRSWPFAVSGIAAIAVAAIAILYPGVTLVSLALLIGVWLVIGGIFEAVAAFQARDRIEGEGWLILGAIFQVIAGVIFVAMPAVGIAVTVLFIGVDAILLGIGLLVAGWKLRSGAKTLESTEAHAAA